MDHDTTQPDDDLDELLDAAADFTDEELADGTYVLSTRGPSTVSAAE
ncbi:hypothetical protein [Streptomyces griseosporeus]